jgi:CheY-like chemotaxis protein
VSLDVDETSCTLCFADAGKGINPDFLRHSIFEAFSQEDPIVEGTGLGLSIVKRTVTALGGELDVDSKETQGSTFTATFPSRRVVFDPSHITELDAPNLPVLQMSVFAPSRWAAEGEVRGGRCSEMLSASLWRSLSRWFQTTVVPWEPTGSELRLLVILEEDVADAKRAYGDAFDHTKRIILCPDLQTSSNMETAPLENIITIIGPVTLSSLQDALAWLFPDIVVPPESHDDIDQLRTLIEDSVDATSARARRREKANSITSRDGLYQATSRLAIETTHLEIDNADALSLDATSRTDFSQSLDEVMAGAAAKLPIVHMGSDQTKELATPAPPPALKPNTKQPKLLLVDDNPVNLKVLSMYARKCSTAAAKSVDGGQKAIDVFKAAFFDDDGKDSQCFDLIFLDLSMPEVSGFDVARQIREMEAKSECRSRVYICALTGLSSDKDRNAAYASGVDQYLVKPARLDDLQWVIERWRDSLSRE